MADSKYSDACYLADYIDIFSKKLHDANPKGYAGFKCVTADKESGGGAHEIISKLTSRNGKSVFLDLEPAAMSLLVPKVRLYKLIYDGRDLIGQKEFIFEYQEKYAKVLSSPGQTLVGSQNLTKSGFIGFKVSCIGLLPKLLISRCHHFEPVSYLYLQSDSPM